MTERDTDELAKWLISRLTMAKFKDGGWKMVAFRGPAINC